MNTFRKSAILVGGLYILGTVAGILSVILTNSILTAPDFLHQVANNVHQIVIGNLFVFVMGLSLAIIPAVMFPILKKQNETLAMGYVIFRGGLETFTYMALMLSVLLLIPISQEFMQTGSAGDGYLQSLGNLSQAATQWITQILAVVFILGAVMFYTMLFQSKLIPRWISIWGLIGAIPYLAAAVLVMLGMISADSTVDTSMLLPIGVQEMVMAVWMIVKGFNPSAMAALSERS
jgi:hypothetical protein